MVADPAERQSAAIERQPERGNGRQWLQPEDERRLQAVSTAIASGGELPQGSVGVLAAVRQDPATDLIVYQAPSGRISSITGQIGLKRALMSAWFGQPADGGLRVLRDEILRVSAGR
jgi:hypothetical protein